MEILITFSVWNTKKFIKFVLEIAAKKKLHVTGVQFQTISFTVTIVHANNAIIAKAENFYIVYFCILF